MSLAKTSLAVALALGAMSSMAGLVVATNDTLEVATPTTIAGPTNIYYRGLSGSTVTADLSLKDKSFLRVIGTENSSQVTYFDIGPAAGNGKVTISTDATSGLYGTYRNSGGEKTATGVDAKISYVYARIGQNGGCATFDVFGRVQPVGYTSFQTMTYGIWFERLYISPNATTDDDCFDIATLHADARFNIRGFYNDGPKPARILFDGGRMDLWYINNGNSETPFRAAEGKPLYLTSVNGNSIVIHKEAKQVANLTFGNGKIYVQGPKFVLDSNSNWDANGKVELRWKYTTGASVFDWSGLTGDIVLNYKSALYLEGSDMLHWGKGTGILQMECNTTPAAGTYDSTRLILNGGTTNHLNGIVAFGSCPQHACVTNDTPGKVATIVLGEGDVDCVLSVNTMAGVDIVKVGKGTLTISNCTVVGSVSIDEGFVKRVGNPVIGEFTVGPNAYEIAPSSQTWTAGGEDDLLANPANWGAAKVDLYTGLMTATFGSAGSVAEVTALAKLRGIVFSLPDAVTSFAFGGEGVLEIGESGILANKKPAENASYSFNGPVVVTANQSWTVPEGDTLTVNGGLSGSATVTKLGAGMLKIAGEFGEADKTTLTHNNKTGGGVIVLDNAVVNAAVTTTASDQNSFYCAPNTTNEIRGYAKITTGSNYGIDVGDQATLILSGGGEITSTYVLGRPGTLIVTNKPFSSNAQLGSSAYGSKLIISVSGNHLQSVYAGLVSSVTEFTVDDVFDPAWILSGGSKGLLYYRASRPLYINRTHQTINRINSYMPEKNHGSIEGDYPAQVDLLTTGSDTMAVDLVGWVSLLKGGYADSVQNITNIAIQSYGDVIVTNGTLRFYANASWLNGTNVTVRGGGILQLDQGDVFNRSRAKLMLEDAGKLVLPNVVTQAFMQASVKDEKGQIVPVPSGVYDKNSTGLMAGRIEGEGAIRVRSSGMVLMLK